MVADLAQGAPGLAPFSWYRDSFIRFALRGSLYYKLFAHRRSPYMQYLWPYLSPSGFYRRAEPPFRARFAMVSPRSPCTFSYTVPGRVVVPHKYGPATAPRLHPRRRPILYPIPNTLLFMLIHCALIVHGGSTEPTVEDPSPGLFRLGSGAWLWKDPGSVTHPAGEGPMPDPDGRPREK